MAAPPARHGKPRVDAQRVLSGIIFFDRNGFRWCDAPKEYGPPKTLYNRRKQRSDKGVFARMMDGLAAEGTSESRSNQSEALTKSIHPAADVIG